MIPTPIFPNHPKYSSCVHSPFTGRPMLYIWSFKYVFQDNNEAIQTNRRDGYDKEMKRILKALEKHSDECEPRNHFEISSKLMTKLTQKFELQRQMCNFGPPKEVWVDFPPPEMLREGPTEVMGLNGTRSLVRVPKETPAAKSVMKQNGNLNGREKVNIRGKRSLIPISHLSWCWWQVFAAPMVGFFAEEAFDDFYHKTHVLIHPYTPVTLLTRVQSKIFFSQTISLSFDWIYEYIKAIIFNCLP